MLTEQELRPVLDLLNGLSWPVPFDGFPEIFERLGWETQHRSGGATSLPVSNQIVSVGRLGDELSAVRFGVTDRLTEAEPVSGAVLDDALSRLSEAVSSCLRFAPTGTPLYDPGLVWDFPDGRQVRLLQWEGSIELMHWSKRMADIERHERGPDGEPQLLFDDLFVSQEHRFSLGEEIVYGTPYLSFPVTNGIVDYEEHYALTEDEYQQFKADPARALPLLEQCRRHEQDHRLIQEPGPSRGIPM